MAVGGWRLADPFKSFVCCHRVHIAIMAEALCKQVRRSKYMTHGQEVHAARERVVTLALGEAPEVHSFPLAPSRLPRLMCA